MNAKPVHLGFTLIHLLGIIVGLVILVGLAIPGINCSPVRRHLTDTINDAKTLGLYLRIYSTHNEGSFPLRMEDVSPKYYDGDHKIFGCWYPEKKERVPWNYLAGLKETAGSRQILFHSPRIHDGRGWVVCCTDGSVQQWGDREFQKLLQEQRVTRKLATKSVSE